MRKILNIKHEFKKTPAQKKKKEQERSRRATQSKSSIGNLDRASSSELGPINEIRQCFETSLNSSEVSDVEIDEEGKLDLL
ncbi:13339_t:CDS:2 [Ambispora gerdemannii]|uniref:13339_t:CDS:1 n=1 Tax=Ambispora gerdemannii TaxID=144530 RepID=A0A9N8UZZ9_9GLOM|nr:13339_t:CDS:2 [Ambispora gerdemannii]